MGADANNLPFFNIFNYFHISNRANVWVYIDVTVKWRYFTHVTVYDLASRVSHVTLTPAWAKNLEGEYVTRNRKNKQKQR